MAHEPDLPLYCFWACRAEEGSSQPPSCFCARPRENLGGWLAHLTPCQGHTFLTPLEQLLAGTPAVCLCIVKVPRRTATAISGLVPRLRDFKSPTLPVLCPQKERLKDLFLAMELAPLRPACGQTAHVYTGAWQGQPAGFQERFCWPVPWVWMDYSPKRQRGSFDPGSTESLGTPFPSVGATSISSLLSTTASSLTLSSAQSPVSSFTSSWSLGPLHSVPGPQISKSLGQGPEHSR